MSPAEEDDGPWTPLPAGDPHGPAETEGFATYRQRFSEHRDHERRNTDRIIAALPQAPVSAATLGLLVYEILTGPETAAATALSRLAFANAELAVVDGKAILRLRAAGKQFIIACAEDA